MSDPSEGETKQAIERLEAKSSLPAWMPGSKPIVVEIDRAAGTVRGRRELRLVDIHEVYADTGDEGDHDGIVARIGRRRVVIAVVPRAVSRRFVDRIEAARVAAHANGRGTPEPAPDAPLVVEEIVASRAGLYRDAAERSRTVAYAGLDAYPPSRILTTRVMSVVLLVGGLVGVLLPAEAGLRVAGCVLLALGPLGWWMASEMNGERVGFVADLDEGFVEVGRVDRDGKVRERGKVVLALRELSGVSTDSIEDSENEWVVAELEDGQTVRLVSADGRSASTLADRLRELVGISDERRRREASS